MAILFIFFPIREEEVWGGDLEERERKGRVGEREFLVCLKGFWGYRTTKEKNNWRLLFLFFFVFSLLFSSSFLGGGRRSHGGGGGDTPIGTF